jgi:isocitrate dehydrogenase kinase/phosphatase
MKEITECIGDIGHANFLIFSTFDLTSGFWQMQLEEKSQPLTAFIIPGHGKYQLITSPMGLLGCPASFQHLMEGVLRNISNVIVYIDDLLVHTKTHEDHLQVTNSHLLRNNCGTCSKK